VTLASELAAGRVLAHPFVIGELAGGALRNRREVLDLLGRLPSRMPRRSTSSIGAP